MKKIIIGSGLGAILLAGGIAMAAPGGFMKSDATVTRAEIITQVDARFAKMDIDKDGKLTPADRTAKQKMRADARFAAMDADANGQISRAEFDAAESKHMERRGDRGDRPGGPGKGGRGDADRSGGHHGMGMMGPGKDMRAGRDGGPGGMMAMIDTNQDGSISLDEMRAHALARFDKEDANKDGKVTPEERQAAFAAMKAEWQAKRAQQKGE